MNSLLVNSIKLTGTRVVVYAQMSECKMMTFMVVISTHIGSNSIYSICYHPGFDAEEMEAQNSPGSQSKSHS